LVTEVVPAELSTIFPLMVLLPVLVLRMVSVFAPEPEAVKSLVKISGPVPSF